MSSPEGILSMPRKPSTSSKAFFSYARLAPLHMEWIFRDTEAPVMPCRVMKSRVCRRNKRLCWVGRDVGGPGADALDEQGGEAFDNPGVEAFDNPGAAPLILT